MPGVGGCVTRGVDVTTLSGSSLEGLGDLLVDPVVSSDALGRGKVCQLPRACASLLLTRASRVAAYFGLPALLANERSKRSRSSRLGVRRAGDFFAFFADGAACVSDGLVLCAGVPFLFLAVFVSTGRAPRRVDQRRRPTLCLLRLCRWCYHGDEERARGTRRRRARQGTRGTRREGWELFERKFRAGQRGVFRRPEPGPGAQRWLGAASRSATTQRRPPALSRGARESHYNRF